MADVAPEIKPSELHRIPDAPGRLPLVGHLVRLFTDVPRLMREVAAQPGPLARLEQPGLQDAVIWKARDSFDLFKNTVAGSHHMRTQGETILGNHSMVSIDGAEHRHLRKAASRPFTPAGLTMSGVSETMRQVITARVGKMVATPRWNLLEHTQTIALDIIFRVMGIPEDQLGDWAAQYSRLLMSMFGPKLKVPPLPYYRGTKAKAWLDERLLGYIATARQDSSATGLISELVRGRDDEGQALSDEEMLDNLRLLVLAGHETTASVMAWMVAHVCQEPGLWDALAQEAQAAGALPATPKEMSNFPLAEGVFREALRLHPPLAMQSREVTTPFEVEGIPIPVGTHLMVPIWLLSRDPELYPDPDEFRPSRWAGGRKLTPIETAQFGGGPHFCLGYHMAWVEAVQFIACLSSELSKAGKTIHLPAGMPRETHMPLTRPRAADCDARVVASAAA